MVIEKAFAKVLRRLRRRQKLSQERFAQKVQLNRSYISQLERGVGNPTLKIMDRIAIGLDVTFGSLTALVQQELDRSE
jgi:transcriptional regulator with XRE-family HTH domain